MNTYIIKEADRDFVKIGKAKCVRSRMLNHQCSNPSELEVIMVEPQDIEKELHRRFQDSWQRGEWFRYTDDIKEYVASKAEQTKAILGTVKKPSLVPPKLRLGKKKHEVIYMYDAQDVYDGLTIPQKHVLSTIAEFATFVDTNDIEIPAQYLYSTDNGVNAMNVEGCIDAVMKIGVKMYRSKPYKEEHRWKVDKWYRIISWYRWDGKSLKTCVEPQGVSRMLEVINENRVSR